MRHHSRCFPVAGEYQGGPLAGRVRLAGELRAEAGCGDRHCGAAGGAAGVVELGEVGGEAHVIERAPGESLVEAARGRGRRADRGLGRGDLGE